MSPTRTTTATTTPSAKRPSAAKPKPKTPTAAKPKTPAKPKPKTTTATKPKPGGQPTLDDLMEALASGDLSRLGAAGVDTLDQLRGSAQSLVWSLSVYMGGGSAFKSARGTTRTKVKASEALARLDTMPSADYNALQEKLFAGGFYKTNNRKVIAFRNRHDPATREAYALALTANVLANENTTKTTRISLDEIIDEAIKNAPEALRDGGDSERAPFSFQPPDPVLLRQTIDEALPSLIGKAVPDDVAERLVSEYMARAESAARSDYAVAESGGIAKPKPDFGAFVKQRAEELFPVDTRVVKREAAADTFFAAITGGSPQTETY